MGGGVLLYALTSTPMAAKAETNAQRLEPSHSGLVKPLCSVMVVFAHSCIELEGRVACIMQRNLPILWHWFCDIVSW